MVFDFEWSEMLPHLTALLLIITGLRGWSAIRNVYIERKEVNKMLNGPSFELTRKDVYISVDNLAHEEVHSILNTVVNELLSTVSVYAHWDVRVQTTTIDKIVSGDISDGVISTVSWKSTKGQPIFRWCDIVLHVEE